MSTYDCNHPMVTIEQWGKFTDEDHQTWGWLSQKQSETLKTHAAE